MTVPPVEKAPEALPKSGNERAEVIEQIREELFVLAGSMIENVQPLPFSPSDIARAASKSNPEQVITPEQIARATQRIDYTNLA